MRREWELEEKKVREDTDRKIECESEEQDGITKEIVKIETKIENSKNSLYGWLNDHIPDWDQTIGKVIDEENVLFRQGLNPQKISDTDLSFYGINIDADQIDKNVKTVADVQEDQKLFQNEIQAIQQTIARFNTQRIDELEKLKRKFKPKIKTQKELIQHGEYRQNNQSGKMG